MKKTFRSMLLIVISVSFCISYANSTSNYTDEKGGPKEISSEIVAYIIEASQDGRVLMYKADTPDKFLPNIGEIVHAMITPVTPHGFLGKVKNIDKGDDVIRVITESISIAEAFPNLSIRSGEIDLIDNIEGVYDADGNPVEYEVIIEGNN